MKSSNPTNQGSNQGSTQGSTSIKTGTTGKGTPVIGGNKGGKPSQQSPANLNKDNQKGDQTGRTK